MATLEELEQRLEKVEASLETRGLTVDQMFEFFNQRVVGTKEFRNFLAKVDDSFAEVRDTQVDDEIDTQARMIAERAAEDHRAMMAREGEQNPQ